MRCKVCMNQCLETDLRCPHCGRVLVGEAPDRRRSAVAVFSVLFAVLGAGTVTIAPTAAGLRMDQAALAGMGAVVGGIFGAAIGLGLDWLFKKDEARAAWASVPEAQPVEPD
jgi:hypothetical protein